MTVYRAVDCSGDMLATESCSRVCEEDRSFRDTILRDWPFCGNCSALRIPTLKNKGLVRGPKPPVIEGLTPSMEGPKILGV